MDGKFYVFFILLLSSCCFLNAQEADTLPRLKVGIKESPPFVFRDEDGRLEGISVQLWENIAEELGVAYEYEELPLAGLLDSLEQGRLDLSINPLTVTSARIEKIDFSQPYYTSSSAVAAKTSQALKWVDFLANFFSIQFLKVVLLLLLVIFLFGLVTWLFERRKNPEEFEAGWKGLWSGLWWSAVTMTTVGYGDKAPKSTGGRIVALIWMFTAIIIISGFTAAIASSLTVNTLGQSVDDLTSLRKMEVGTVSASASERFLKDNYIRPQTYSSVEEGLNKLTAQEVGAFVYDEPILRFQINRNTLTELEVLPFRFNPQYYSFGFPKRSRLIEKINPLLLAETEKATWRIILADYGLTH